MTIQEKIAMMQRKAPAGAKVWQNANGTFSHHKDAQREWADEAGCRTDLRFNNEWGGE